MESKMSEVALHDGPVLMIVQGTVTDGDHTLETSPRMQEYLRQLFGSEMYPTTSGYYIYSGGQPIDIFEGEFPKTGFTVVARFPSQDAARTFWYSEMYQKVAEARQGACEVLVCVYPETEVPDYMQGRLNGHEYVNVPSFDHVARVD
jgi:uncharacterized protein (DUF1330 family)